MFTWMTNAQERLSLKEQRKARFTMSHEGHKYLCEECGHDRFRKTTKVRANCAECDVSYLVEYSKLEVDIVYFEG